MKGIEKASSKELLRKLELDYSDEEKSEIRSVLISRKVLKSEVKTLKMLTLEEKKIIKKAYISGKGSYRKLEKLFGLKDSNGKMVMTIVKADYA